MFTCQPTPTFPERVAISERAAARHTDAEIVTALGCSVWTVRKWRRFAQRYGSIGLRSRIGRLRTGPLSSYAPQLRHTILQPRHDHPGWGPATPLATVHADPVRADHRLPSRARGAALRTHAGLTRR